MDKRMNILKQATENIGKAQEKQKKDYNKRHHCPDTFKVGTLVLRKDMTRKKERGESWIPNGQDHLKSLPHWVVVFTSSVITIIQKM